MLSLMGVRLRSRIRLNLMPLQEIGPIDLDLTQLIPTENIRNPMEIVKPKGHLQGWI